MKKEELISSVIMCIVSVLVLVGFTIAWFTAGGSVVATGLQLMAGEMSTVKISLTPGGVDIEEDGTTFLEQFATFGMPDYSNVETDKIAVTDVKDENRNVTQTNVAVEEKELGPGTSGKITFYVTPESGNLTFCDVSPMLAVTEDGETWYTAENIAECTSENLKKAHEIALRHILFYTDEEFTEIADTIRLSWEAYDVNVKDTTELPVTFYWKWDYENSDIANYDEEDMFLGNHVSGMKFQFTFIPQ